MESGICQCGCGKSTPLAERDNPKRGDVAGQPMQLLWGHKKPKEKLRGRHAIELPCGGCQQTLPVAQFYWYESTEQYDFRCKTCRTVERKSYNSKENAKKHRKKTRLNNLYGLTVSEFETMLQAQNGKCAICHVDFKESGKHPCVDHNHDTGEVRELLCNTCNVLVGYTKERKDLIFKVYEYLDKHEK